MIMIAANVVEIALCDKKNVATPFDKQNVTNIIIIIIIIIILLNSQCQTRIITPEMNFCSHRASTKWTVCAHVAPPAICIYKVK